MTFDATISFGTILAAAATIAGVWWRLNQSIVALSKELDQERQSRIQAVAVTVNLLAEYKLQVAREYATTQAIQQVEERVVQAIERLGDRLDKFLDARSTRSR